MRPTGARSARWILAVASIGAVAGCSDPDSGVSGDDQDGPDLPMDAAWTGEAGGAGKADGWNDSRLYEVLLTEPHCDECTADDKSWLLAHSPIIERVVALIDGATTRVDVAQFTFSRKEIEAALVAAYERGVAVRVAMDSGQDREGSLSRRLAASGVPLRFVKGRSAGGGAFAGIQHAKFMVVDGGIVATGSNNWSSTGTSINEENTIVIGGASADPLIAGFICHFDAIWAGDPDSASACSNEVVAFTPSTSGFKRIRNELRASQRSVDILMHHLKYDKLVKELAKAAERGVRVRVLVNEPDRAEHSGPSWDRLFTAGGLIRFKRNNAEAYQLMHHKLVVVDDSLLINGSGNWSGSAFFNNFENYVRYGDPRVVSPFVDLFDRLWSWSRDADALDRGLTAAQQHAQRARIYFGNLHAHHVASDGGRLLDDGLAVRLDSAGVEVPVDVGTTHEAAVRHAFEYARDQGGLDFMALSPHVTEERSEDPPDMPNMTEAGYDVLRTVAAAVTAESDGKFAALASMEWNTNSAGNHVGILGSSRLCKVERDRFDLLYDGFLPDAAALGDRPVVMFNHPRTFRHNAEFLTGSWDQIFGVPLSDIANNSQRNKKFNDFGLDDYPPMADVRASWISGEVEPDEAVVEETLRNIAELTRRWIGLMEVTIGRGKELGGETAVNPSMTDNPDNPGVFERFAKVHSDWDHYLRWGFELAPVANHDNHMANWGRGHTTRTAVVTEEPLSEGALLAAMRRRAVYATEDADLQLRMYADDRIPMGGRLTTLAQSASLTFRIDDPGATSHDVTLFVGQVGGPSVDAKQTLRATPGGWTATSVNLPSPGRWFVYLEVHDPVADRMAWSAPIWIERLE